MSDQAFIWSAPLLRVLAAEAQARYMAEKARFEEAPGDDRTLEQELNAVFDPPRPIDSAALMMACDLYCSEVGEVDDLAMGAAILTYEESARANRCQS